MSSAIHSLQQTNLDFNQSREQALAILCRLTQPQLDEEGKEKRQIRLESCLREPEAKNSPGWFMCVPSYFNDPLDIRQTERIENGVKRTVWTQGGNFSFKPGYMIHDTEKGYLVWREALQHLRFSLCVTRAMDVSPAQNGAPRIAGYVMFDVFVRNSDRTQAVFLKNISLTQDAFVRLLITGEGLPKTGES